MATLAQKQFEKWVSNNDPFLYEIALKKYELENKELAGGVGDFFSSLVDTVKKVAPTIITYKGQKKILDVQIQRAKNGLPPLQADQYTPTVKVQAELTPENERAAQRIAINTAKEGVKDMQKYFFGGLLLLGFVFYNKRR